MRETCGAVRDELRCDRERHHPGNHRGYDEQHDEPQFWADAIPLLVGADVTELKAQLAAAEAERDRALKELDEATQELVVLHNTCGKYEAALSAARHELQALREPRRETIPEHAPEHEKASHAGGSLEQLEDWRAAVTVALQRPGGAFFEDVPNHIRELVSQLAAARQAQATLQERCAVLIRAWNKWVNRADLGDWRQRDELLIAVKVYVEALAAADDEAGT
jgi:hypothetical protein